jgi:hypothetical protein
LPSGSATARSSRGFARVLAAAAPSFLLPMAERWEVVDGALGRGPRATSARPGRLEARWIWRPAGRTEPLRPTCRPPVQPKNGKSDLQVALAALYRPQCRQSNAPLQCSMTCLQKVTESGSGASRLEAAVS